MYPGKEAPSNDEVVARTFDRRRSVSLLRSSLGAQAELHLKVMVSVILDRSFCEDRRESNPITFAITFRRFGLRFEPPLNLTIILYQIISQKSNNLVAQALGLEPRRTVLETAMLPLHHTHMLVGGVGVEPTTP